MLGINRALQETLPALGTTVAIAAATWAFVALLAAAVVAAWSMALYFWLRESMTAPEAAFLVGAALLILCVVSLLACRAAIKSDLTPPKRKQDALQNAIEAIGDMAETRPVPALIGALALGLAAGYFENGDRDQRPR